MSKRRKRKAAENRSFPFPLEADRKAPADWRIVWVHPKGRYKIVEYRVKTPMGQLSEPMRECFWTLPLGKEYPTEKRRTGYLTKTKLERIANESE